MYVEKVERGASIPKRLTSSEKNCWILPDKAALDSEMADTSSKTRKATFSVMARNLCIKPFLPQEPEDSAENSSKSRRR